MRRWLAAACVLLAAPALAEEPPSVTTHATARERLPNTVADVQVSVESRGKTPAEVRGALSAASPPLLAALNEAKARRVRTAALEVRPELDTNASGRPPRVTGYVGRLSTAFQVEAEQLGSVLAATLDRGATGIDETVLHPRQEEIDAARDRLAAEATRLALNQARAVAEAAGRGAGPVRSIQVQDGSAAPGRMEAMPAPPMLRLSSAAPVATAAGDTEITARVVVVMGLTGP